MSESRDQDWFNQLWEEHFHYVFGYLLKLTQNHSSTEELSAETFLRAWLKRDQYHEQGTPRAWLVHLARSLLIDRYRTEKVKTLPHTYAGTQFFETIVSPTGGQQDYLELEHTQTETYWRHYCQTQLTGPQFEVLSYSLEGYHTEEIARLTGQRTGTIRALKMRALHKLRKLLISKSHAQAVIEYALLIATVTIVILVASMLWSYQLLGWWQQLSLHIVNQR